MSRSIQEIEAELDRARKRCNEFALARDAAERRRQEWLIWIGELTHELSQAKKEARDEH